VQSFFFTQGKRVRTSRGDGDVGVKRQPCVLSNNITFKYLLFTTDHNHHGTPRVVRLIARQQIVVSLPRREIPEILERRFTAKS